MSRAFSRSFRLLGLLVAFGVMGLIFRMSRDRARAGSPAASGGAATSAEPASAPPAANESPTAGNGGSSSAAPEADPEQRYPGLTSLVLADRNSALMDEMHDALALTDTQLGRVRDIFAHSDWLGQGNPKITQHPMTRAECRAARARAASLPAGDPRCAAVNMVPIYDPSAGETAESAKVCIDQYEFPNIPCEYPVVWVRADQAVALCKALDKRICDAHEWEGACAGAVKKAEDEYAFGQRRLMIEYLHNKDREIVWAYGKEKDHSRCATGSKKSATCTVIDWGLCGSNTYPAGAFPECRSAFGVFDQHGNAAEHMNMPLLPNQLASRGGLGETEMKGSWFIFSTYEAHQDDCRWRAPMWHKTRIDDPGSHRNYHLGFRCCKDI